MPIKKFLSLLSNQEISRPIFILGCGRSGTTVFGTSLSKHNEITYLNERRDLWFDAYPETDIWTDKASLRAGKMSMTAEDAEKIKSQRLRRLFYKETVKTSKPILVEKLPINNFRVEFINSIFPDARFIHIYRNGLEVARSIQKFCEKGDWFGSNDYKWQRLKDYARSNRSTAKLPDLCDSLFYKGLLEWRLSTESAVNFLSNLPRDRYIEISYATFTGHPEETIKCVLSYIGVGNDPEIIEYVREKVSRKTSSLDNNPPNDKELEIGGRLLPLSIGEFSNGLTAACG